MTIIAFLKTPDKPCSTCGGITRYPKSKRCVACKRREVANYRERNPYPAYVREAPKDSEERVMKNVRYD